MSRITRYIELLKNDAYKASYPPKYQSDARFYNRFRDIFNCYAYALQLRIPLTDYEHLYSVGNISGIRQEHFDFEEISELTYCFQADCDALNIDSKRVYDLEPNRAYTYRVALTLQRNLWHILRLNQDNQWSCKNGWIGKVEKYNSFPKLEKGTQIQILELKKL